MRMEAGGAVGYASRPLGQGRSFRLLEIGFVVRASPKQTEQETKVLRQRTRIVVYLAASPTTVAMTASNISGVRTRVLML